MQKSKAVIMATFLKMGKRHERKKPLLNPSSQPSWQLSMERSVSFQAHWSLETRLALAASLMPALNSCH